MTPRPAGLAVVRASLAIVVLAGATLCGAEELVCRGFTATEAAAAASSHTGTRLRLDRSLEAVRSLRLWFALPDRQGEATRQALGHALSAWWTGSSITASPRLGGGSAEVRTYPRLPLTPPGAESLIRRALDPWLDGDGGVALDLLNGTWTATALPAGQARLEGLLAALGDPHPRAPHLLPTAGDPGPAHPLARGPAGADLASWAIDLMRISGLAVSLAQDVDPAAPAPPAAGRTLGEALAGLRGQRLQAAVLHRCVCIAAADPMDRQHPAERATIAILPVSHLCRDATQLARLANQLTERVRPAAWSMPGWLLSPLAHRNGLLVIADPPTIHAVMQALEAADLAGLDAWLR